MGTSAISYNMALAYIEQNYTIFINRVILPFVYTIHYASYRQITTGKVNKDRKGNTRFQQTHQCVDINYHSYLDQAEMYKCNVRSLLL